MGYYSTFTVRFEGPVDDIVAPGSSLIFKEAVEPVLRHLAEELGAISEYPFDVLSDGSVCCSDVKWYNAELDLARLSAAHPRLRITCRVLGEDGEQWVIYAYDGKSESVGAIINFPPASIFP